MHFKRHRHRRHAKRPVFSKRAVRAIKAISQEHIETKKFIYYENLVSAFPPNSTFVGGKNVSFIHNIMEVIPKLDTDSVFTQDTADSVVGLEFQARGIAMRYQVAVPTPLASDPGSQYHQCKVRLTIISMAPYFSTTAGGTNYVVLPQDGVVDGGTAPIRLFEEDDATNNATFRRWNMEQVHVLESETFTLSSGGQQGWLKEGKMWHRMNRRCRIAEEETSDLVRNLKDMNFYFVAEFYDPWTFVGGESLNASWNLTFSDCTYFKDA